MHFKTNLIGIISLLIFILVFTKDGLPQNPSYLDSLDGKFALQFQITQNFTLTNFQGTVFSGKYHFSNRDAIRLGLSLDFSSSEYEESRKYIDTNLVPIKSESKPSTFGLRINTQYLKYFPATNDISCFGGTGPFFGYNTSETEYKFLSGGLEELTKETSDYWEIGLNLIVGVEWMFYDNLTLSAEYGIEFFYRSVASRREEQNSITESSIKTYDVAYRDIKFGITVYF